MLILRKYLIGSLIAHLIIILIASLAGLRTHSIKQTFVVFGARSSKPSSTSYKSFKNTVPFVSQAKKSEAPQIKSAPAKKSSSVKPTVKKTVATKKTASKNSKKTPAKKSKVPQKKTSSKIAPLKEAKPTKSSKKLDKKVPAEKPKIKKPEAVEKKQPKVDNKIIKKQELSPKEQPQPVKETPPAEPPQAVAPEVQPHTPENIRPLAVSLEQAQPDNQEQDLGTIVIGGNDAEHVNEYQKVINQEAARVWRPPLGVPQGTTCFVTFTIARDGSHESDLTQKSPVIIYDLSVMRAARAMKFPKSLWGKQFKIAFHQ